MTFTLDQVVDICEMLMPDLWKYDDGHICTYDDGRLIIKGQRCDYLGNMEILAAFDTKQFLWYREDYADSRYVYNEGFEQYIEENDTIRTMYAKKLLLEMGDY